MDSVYQRKCNEKMCWFITNAILHISKVDIHDNLYIDRCLLYKCEEWVKSLIDKTYVQSIVERFSHNTIWVEAGDVTM